MPRWYPGGRALKTLRVAACRRTRRQPAVCLYAPLSHLAAATLGGFDAPNLYRRGDAIHDIPFCGHATTYNSQNLSTPRLRSSAITAVM